MDQAVIYITNHWEIFTIATLVIDKIVAMTPNRYDDMIFTSIKALFLKVSGK